jgi:hypothetical protein
MLSVSEQNLLDYSSPYFIFKYSIRNELTRKDYERRLYRFFDYVNFLPGEEIEKRCNFFAQSGKESPNWALNKIIFFLQYQKERSTKGEITPATLGNFVKAIKLFCEMSDIQVPWKKITRGLPRIREAANDRSPTIEEIKKLIEYPDRRIKPIILVMASSGIRMGAWEYLKWKHVTPIRDEKDRLIAAKIVVYAGDVEDYFSFITPEAYNHLKEWMNFRASYGEDINEESWLMRDLWQITNSDYGKKTGLATCPRKLKSGGIKSIIERALREQGLRKPLPLGKRRHEWKGAHGFRKFYKTRAEQVMRPANVELTMGHNIGISASYYKPTEREVLEDYLQAVELLTITGSEQKLSKEVQELKEKSKDTKYILEGKLIEKDKEIQTLRQQESSNSDAIAILADQVRKLTEQVEAASN